MTKFSKLALAALLGMAVMTTTASADAAKGQKLYSKKLKEACKMTGADFAKKHTQEEWEKINEDGKMGEAIAEICGEGVSIKEKLVPHIFDFANEFASDSGNVPSC
ncbi:cytochrome C [Sulfurovum sp. bin170]|uniref:cytochrome C n=1 Tax=Sulfurovum sp. bin170 TaxID=2695268 RepID=UPI0013DEA45E|nr:cytochrome C [Sulfurovum sp. bin170]NEW61124.1 cytochrome C [Sulfurovum sp. bin170]